LKKCKFNSNLKSIESISFFSFFIFILDFIVFDFIISVFLDFSGLIPSFL